MSADAQAPTNSHRLWSVQVAQFLHEPPGSINVEHHETRAVAFSADDKRLAVTVQHVERGSRATLASVLILDSAFPEVDVDRIDLADNCGADLRWNPRGDALLVCGALLPLADRAACNAAGSMLSRYSGAFHVWWLDSDHVVNDSGQILDLHCKQTGRWTTEPGWLIIDTVPSKDWLLLRSLDGASQRQTCRYSINDRQSHRPLMAWPSLNWACTGYAKIIAGAEMICPTFEETLRCMSVNGGRNVAIPKKLRKYSLDQASDASARVIAQKWDTAPVPWWMWPLAPLWLPVAEFGPAFPQQAVVFDLHTGQVVSSWKPRIQDSISFVVQERPFHLALSGHGNLVAESGDGTIELFQLTQ